MSIRYEQLQVQAEPLERSFQVRFRLITTALPHSNSNGTRHVGWQLFDPDSGLFLKEGDWFPAPSESGASVQLVLALPRHSGRYHVYVCLLDEDGWFYDRREPFVLLDAEVEQGRARLLQAGITTLAALRRQRRWRSLREALVLPLTSLRRHRRLISSLAKRDILARYRGSMGDVAWTVLNPLLLMSTYAFVFGVVLKTRFGGDQSGKEYVLYFLAGMLPWLAFSEAIGRAPHAVLEQRSLVKKLVFPLEILPVIPVAAGLLTQCLTMGLFLLGLLFARGAWPVSLVWLPAVMLPQVLLTLGLSWLLAALGVYLRDIGQLIGFALTLLFFLTPICYPEANLPAAAATVLTKNPIYVLVRAYRMVLLDGQAPWPVMMGKLWVLAAVVFFAGHAVFHKLRRQFVDVL